MNSILSQYQVHFSRPWGYPFYNKIETINDIMSAIIEDHYTKSEANAFLNSIDSVINDANDDSEVMFIPNSLELAVVNKTRAYFYENFDVFDNDPSLIPVFTLPTEHFRIIAQAWRDYIHRSWITPS
jgi:hypothetical protein